MQGGCQKYTNYVKELYLTGRSIYNETFNYRIIEDVDLAFPRGGSFGNSSFRLINSYLDKHLQISIWLLEVEWP